jgi:hypothetical protein
MKALFSENGGPECGAVSPPNLDLLENAAPSGGRVVRLYAVRRSRKHPVKALSPALIRKLTTPGLYGDGNCLYLVVDDSGAKRWMLRVTIHRKRHDIGLGGLSIVSLAEAREEAAKLRKLARAGGDPLAERRSAKKVIPTFEAAARQVYAAHATVFRSEKHRKQWITSLERYVFPQLGDRRVDVLQSADVLGSSVRSGHEFQKRLDVFGNA